MEGVDAEICQKVNLLKEFTTSSLFLLSLLFLLKRRNKILLIREIYEFTFSYTILTAFYGLSYQLYLHLYLLIHSNKQAEFLEKV